MRIKQLASKLNVSKTAINQHIKGLKPSLVNHITKIGNHLELDNKAIELISLSFHSKIRKRKVIHQVTNKFLIKELNEKQATILNQRAIINHLISNNSELSYQVSNLENKKNLLIYKKDHESVWSKIKRFFK